jgi:protein SCO1
MNKENSVIKSLFIGMLLILIFVFLSSFVIKQAEKSRSDLPTIIKVPAFEFTDTNGESYGNSEMQGSLVVLDFIFTNCPGACPIMSSKMSELYKLYSHSNKVSFVSITVDPARDTQKVLNQYALSQGVNDQRWIFLRSSIDAVIWLSEKGFLLPAENLPMGHSSNFVLVDQQGFIRGYYNALEEAPIELLKSHIQSLAKKM